MKKLTYIILGIALTFVSCENTDENPNPDFLGITITVYNAEEWSYETPQPVCSGAVVKLISSSNSLTELTDEEGKAFFKDFEIGIYEIQVAKDNLSNIFDKDTSGRGFVATGIFQNQQEIDNYAIQLSANPGDLKIHDMNNDNKIDDNDRVSETFYVPYIDMNADLIINELDKVIINDKGEMGYKIKANLDMDIYISR